MELWKLKRGWWCLENPCSNSLAYKQRRKLKRGGKKKLIAKEREFTAFFLAAPSKGNKEQKQIILKDKHCVLKGASVWCAKLLIAVFQSQFQRGFVAVNFSRVQVDARDSVDTTIEGVTKIIRELPSGKLPGPDGIWKPDMLIAVKITARCLALIYESSLDPSKTKEIGKCYTDT